MRRQKEGTPAIRAPISPIDGTIPGRSLVPAAQAKAARSRYGETTLTWIIGYGYLPIYLAKLISCLLHPSSIFSMSPTSRPKTEVKRTLTH